MGYFALEYVYRKHDQQQEYVRQLRKGYKPEGERSSADLRPHWSMQAIDIDGETNPLIWPAVKKAILLAAEQAGAGYCPDRLFDGLVSYLIKIAMQYPALFVGLLGRTLQFQEEAPPPMFNIYFDGRASQ